jgi:hypothetical protein
MKDGLFHDIQALVNPLFHLQKLIIQVINLGLDVLMVITTLASQQGDLSLHGSQHL